MVRKKIIIAIILLSGFTGVFAQTNDDKLVRFGIRAGAGLQTIYGDAINGDKLKNDFRIGYHAGVTADLLVAPGFYLQPALIYSVKGAKRSVANTDVTENISYVELPVNILLKPELGNGRLLLGAGPYIAYGIDGFQKSEAANLSGKLNAKFKNTITADDISAADVLNNNYYFLKPFDFGANVLAGYDFNSGFNIQINGQFGLTNMQPKIEGVTTANKANAKHLGFGISVGYKF
ncbi:MAG: PorT family protein [Chitinophagaceae bacterium]|nr:PorT family protein [Chitinophagaceae bacterium]